MRPGGIQDEGSDHDHQTVDKRYRSWCKRLEVPPKYYLNWRYSQTYNAFKQMLRNLNWRYSHLNGIPTKIYSQTEKAVQTRIRRSGSLSIARRRQLDTLEFEIYKHTTLMMKDLRTAAHSQLINPALTKKLAAVKIVWRWSQLR